MLKNTETHYGLLSMLLHWVTALCVVGLFALGLWMSGLEHQDAWYNRAPDLHKSIGLSLLLLTLVRIIWLRISPKPQPLPASRGEHIFVAAIHGLLYLLLFGVMFSGYMIATGEGHGIAVFGWFEVPALPWQIEHQADIAGEVHEILAFVLMGLMLLHAAAALKHHFVLKDNTLRRMLGLKLN